MSAFAEIPLFNLLTFCCTFLIIFIALPAFLAVFIALCNLTFNSLIFLCFGFPTIFLSILFFSFWAFFDNFPTFLSNFCLVIGSIIILTLILIPSSIFSHLSSFLCFRFNICRTNVFLNILQFFANFL